MLPEDPPLCCPEGPPLPDSHTAKRKHHGPISDTFATEEQTQPAAKLCKQGANEDVAVALVAEGLTLVKTHKNATGYEGVCRTVSQTAESYRSVYAYRGGSRYLGKFATPELNWLL